MSETTYKEQTKRFDEAAAALVRADIDLIRCSKDLRAFERKRKIAAIVRDDLSGRGRFIRTRDDEIFFFDRATRQLARLDDDEFRASIHHRFGLNPTEDETRFVAADLVNHAFTSGERVEARSFAFFDRGSGCLFVDANKGQMFMLDGQRITTVDNGQDRVLFQCDRRAEPIQPDWSSGDFDAFHELFAGLNLQGDPRRALALLKVWTIGLFFAELLPVRPLLLLVANQGAGKTSFARRVGCTLYGRDFEVSSFRNGTGEADFLAAVSAKRLVVFDNADARLPWLADHLAKLATGSEIERRKLYTTNTLVTYRPNCFLILTARTTPWKQGREDVVQRLLPIHLATIEGVKLPEQRLRQVILDARPRIWAALLHILNEIVGALRMQPDSETSHHRLADFHVFGRVAARVLGIEKDFEEAMAALNVEQFGLLAQGDERFELFGTWVRTISNGRTVETTARQLYGQLQSLFTGRDQGFPFPSATALGTWIGINRKVLETCHGIHITSSHGRRENTWFFEKALPE
ncbi:MAG TPA: hypothetical protein VNK46_06905 [Nitrospiraceae bacterium]|jgi:hypothetical protein|nr:hypothetical protein [Nitrospiraceae bacterium]